MASEQELIESQDKRIAALKAMLEETKQQLQEARSLLLRSNDLLQPGFGATDEQREQHAKEIRAFLAEPQG